MEAERWKRERSKRKKDEQRGQKVGKHQRRNRRCQSTATRVETYSRNINEAKRKMRKVW